MDNWHNFSMEETLAPLKTTRHGLSEGEARERLRKYSRNKLLPREKAPWVPVFLRHLASPLIYILLAADAIELFYMGKPTDAGVIFTILLINSLKNCRL